MMSVLSHPAARKSVNTRPPGSHNNRHLPSTADACFTEEVGLVDGPSRFRIADTGPLLFGAFRLVYDTYLRSCLMRPNTASMRITPYHLSSTTDVFVTIEHEKVVCTMSLVRDGKQGLPMESTYAEEVESRREAGSTIAEVTCLAGKPKSLGVIGRVAMRLMGFMAQHAWRSDVDELLIVVHPEHTKFYHRLLAFNTIGPDRSYPAVCNMPGTAMSLNLNRAAVDQPPLFRRFFDNFLPDDVFQHRPIPPNTLEQMQEVLNEINQSESTWQRNKKPAVPV